MKNIVITGTSRGIGLELVKILAREGNTILALSRNPEVVKSLNFKNVKAFSFDITQEESLKKAGQFVSANWKQVDILINNAGALVNKAFEEISAKEFQQIYSTNVLGVAALIQELLNYFKKNSHVLNISTMGAVQGSAKFPGLSAYSSSKAALVNLTELLAEEYKENGPAFNVLALGAVQTEMLEEAFPGYKAPVSAKEMAAYIAHFSKTGNAFYNGKILQVSNSTP